MPSRTNKEEHHRRLTSIDLDDSMDDEDSLLSDTHAPLDRRLRPSFWQPSGFFAIVLFVSASIISATVGGVIGYRAINLDKTCAAYTTQYSPVLKDVDIKYEMRNFNGSFMAETIYRKPGSPEVDAAWEALGVNSRAGIIPASEGAASGLTKHHVQASDKYGGGFFVNVEGMHHLHCLDLMRQALWYNYDYYKARGKHAFQNDEFILKLHVSHCMDTLRQVLMCNVDTGVLGQVWYMADGMANAFPDFQTRHKCKNFDEVRKWAVAHQAPVDTDLPEDFMRAPKKEDIGPGI